MMKASLISGGVDSLFASILYLEQKGPPLGICGIFTEKMWKLEEAIRDTYNRLGIEVIFFDLVEEFREKIILPFARDYIEGLTPNPCARCNTIIKFGLLYSLAKAKGAQGCISGHYASIQKKEKDALLYRGIDEKKEQSYFLCLLSKEQLREIELPLGRWSKGRVRQEIRNKRIKIPCVRESQEVCFIEGDYREFLRSLFTSLPPAGPIMGVWGEKLGEHQGLYAYTIGQRRGLKIPYKEPLYVIEKDVKQNILIVGRREDLLKDSCKVKALNFLEDITRWPDRVFIKYNYNMPLKRAQIGLQEENKVKVIFDQKIPRPSPGQVCCFYSEEGKVLGGGIIE